MVLLDLFQVVVPTEYDLFTQEIKSKRVRRQNYFFEFFKTFNHEFSEGSTREHLELARVLNRGHEHPLSLVSQAVKLLITDYESNSLQVSGELV